MNGTEVPYSDGDEVEERIARVVRTCTNVTSGSSQLEGGIVDWPSRYHLSSQRGRVLRPFLERMTGPVLEVGAGMGAVTRALAETGLPTVALEGSPRRAEICADRLRGLDTAVVVQDAVQRFAPGPVFGTVLAVGLVEYARVYGAMDGPDDPVDVLLRHLRSLVAPDGQLILAIENQLGLKYLAGYPEDHLGRPMVGVEDRYARRGPVTFGRRELGARLAAAGFPEQEWWYPFPDYKLPTAILSHAATERTDVDLTPVLRAAVGTDHQRPARPSFEPSSAWSAAQRNGLVAELAHSFLVRAGSSPCPGDSTLAWYFGSPARSPQFAKETRFIGTSDGVKVRRDRTGSDHSVTDGVELVLENEDFVAGRPWTDELRDVISQPGWQVSDVVAWARVWWDAVRERSGLKGEAIGRDAVLPSAALDATPRNLLLGSTGPVFVDCEWRRRDQVTAGYLVFRALVDALLDLGTVAEPHDGVPLRVGDLVRSVAAELGMRWTEDDIVGYTDLEDDFQSRVTGHDVRPFTAVRLDSVLATHGGLELLLADAARADQLDDLQAELGKRCEEVAALTGQLVVAMEAVAEAVRAGDVAQAKLDAVQATVSWRLTAPLRALRRVAARG